MTAPSLAAPSGTTPRLPAPTPRPGRHVLADAGAMVARSLRLVRREPDELVLGLVLPVMLMILFVYVFGGAMSVGTDYVTYATPGIVLLCAGYGASNTAIAVEQDMSGGIMDRFRSMPIVASTVLVGHLVASVVKNLVTTAVVLVVALLVGFRPVATPLEWVAAVGVVAAYVVAITSVAAFVGVLVRSPAAAGGFGFFMLFLPYVSSAFVPPVTMPAWLRGFAEHQPVTSVIETIRGLLVGLGSDARPVTDLGTTAVLALAWCAGLTVVFLGGAAWAFARRRR
ncbi:ABC transporter permease [Cellulosimicrobium sp. BIT-GX5]|uniref:Transport permease protein n=1 Tax=Cellulosimicrobium composti TaxID=2672572 RepID=A0A6N7ZEY5_9MICO|nr:ABC transporter permease [Cellulosimicrobium composti]MTG87971.1 ABC transporter permease [Cellulosimicrobium composti]